MKRIMVSRLRASQYIQYGVHMLSAPMTGMIIVKLLQRTACLILLLSGLVACGDMFQAGSVQRQREALDVPLPADAQRRAMQNEKEEQYLAALSYWKHAEGAISARISVLSKHLKTISDEHAQNGIALFEDKKRRSSIS